MTLSPQAQRQILLVERLSHLMVLPLDSSKILISRGGTRNKCEPRISNGVVFSSYFENGEREIALQVVISLCCREFDGLKRVRKKLVASRSHNRSAYLANRETRATGLAVLCISS
jgi:hypothetical protein